MDELGNVSPKQIGIDEFLNSCTIIHEETVLAFENVGEVQLTTLTRANLSLLRRAREKGFPGIVISCPDFERESIAVAFLAALQHLEEDPGPIGLHDPVAGERAAIGDTVIQITKANDNQVSFISRDENKGFLRQYFDFPLVHRAASDAELTKTKGQVLKADAERYDSLPEGQGYLLDACGKVVPSIGYVSSPSQYLNEPPTHLLNGTISIEGNESALSRTIPLSYVSPKGQMRRGFGWPFEVSDSIVAGPRDGGVGSAYQIVELVRDGHRFDFVSFNIPSPDVLETTLISDILELVDEGVGVIGFCDRWTLDRMGPLKDQGFLIFDWDNCEIVDRIESNRLSPIQETVREGQHEKVIPVKDGESGLARIKQILYERLENAELYTDDALLAKQELFRSLGAAIRMTEAPDEEYCAERRDALSESLDAIESSRSLSPEGFEDLCEACELLEQIFTPGNVLPKEEKIYDLIAGRLDYSQPVVLVVDSDRTEQVYEYWRDELEFNGYSVDGFRVMNTRDFMAARGLEGTESIIFSGWYDRGTMDRAVHSGIASDMTFVLYNDGKAGLELEWWRRANDQWHYAADRCAKETDKTLQALGIEKIGRASKTVKYTKQQPLSQDEREKDASPTAIITQIERKRLQKDVAREGERSEYAIPVMFNDGSHVWLRAGEGSAKGGRLVVITDCLDGFDDEPERKPANALLPGDVVLRTHSDRDYIRKTSKERTSGYQSELDIAQKWKEPINKARASGMTDSEIIKRIKAFQSTKKSDPTIRGWIKGDRIAPQSEDDIRAIFNAFHSSISDEEIKRVCKAASRIRSQHQKTGMMAAESMVRMFLDDVSHFGVDGAVSGFDERHENGNVELLRISAVGEKMRVAVERVNIV